MKRKDFDLIAKTIKALPVQPLARIAIAERFIDALEGAEGCTGFDRILFMKRCGVELAK